MENQMTVKRWLGTLLLLAIPLVNLVLLLMWAFGKENPRKNYARASLILFSISIGLALVLGVLGAMFSGSWDTSDYDLFMNEELDDKLTLSDLIIINNASTSMTSKTITGKVKNNSTTDTYYDTFIIFNVYDSENSIVDEASVRINQSIPPGETFRFEDGVISHDDAVSLKITHISAKR
jgi:hypothetical protein